MISTTSLRSVALDRIAAQWVGLGGQLSGIDERTPIDLEALIAMTSEYARHEPRIYGVAVDWCAAFGSAIHSGRLKKVAQELGVATAALGPFGGDVISSGGPRWPFATIGTGYVARGKVAVNDLAAPSRLSWRVRSAFGVHARSDILSILLTVPHTPMTVADLARRARYTKKNVALAVRSMGLAGLISVVRIGNEDRIALERSSPLRTLLEPDGVPDIDWVSRWAVVSRSIEIDEGTREAQTTIRIVDTRAVTNQLMPLLGPAALPLPDLTAVGSEFGAAFDEWLESVATVLTSMSA